METRHLLHQSVAASTRSTRKHVKSAEGEVRSLRAHLDRLTEDHPRRADLRVRLDAALERQAAAVDRHERLARELEEPLGVIAAHAPHDEYVNLVDLNSWFDLLLPEREPLLARDALAALALHPLARRQVTEWEERLATPARCAVWLAEQRFRLRGVLDAVYATRNLSLHSGVFATEGDTVLGLGSVMVSHSTRWSPGPSPA